MNQLKDDGVNKFPLSAWIFGGWIFLLLLCSRIFFIGYFVDDATYILMARLLNPWTSLVHMNDIVTFKDLFPGFPILLAPFVYIFGSTSALLRLVPIGGMAVAGASFYLLEKNDLEMPWATLAFLLFIFNSTVVRFSGAVMAESSFLAFNLASAYLLIHRPNTRRWLVVSGMLGFMALIRPQGIIFLLAMFVSLLNKNSWRRTFLIFTLAFFVYLGLLAAIYFQTGSLPIQFNLLYQNQSHLSLLRYLGKLKTIIGITIPGAFLSLLAPANLLVRRGVAWGSIITIFFLAGRGAYYRWQDPWTRLSFTYLAFSLLFLPLWIGFDIRYALILMPFLTHLVVVGLVSRGSGLSRLSLVSWIFIIFVIGSHLHENYFNLKDSLITSSTSQPPNQTFQYIRKTVGPEERVLTNQAPTVYLYTNKNTVVYFLVSSEDEFVRKIKEKSIGYVIIQNGSLVAADPDSVYTTVPQKIQEWVRSSRYFVKVFSNPAESTDIYKVVNIPLNTTVVKPRSPVI